MARPPQTSRYVIHAYDTDHPEGNQITHQLDDHWFRIPPNEPFEVDYDSNGRKLDEPGFYKHVLLQQLGPIYGLVEVPMEKTRSGITLDVEGALAASKRQLLLNRHAHINACATEQLQERVRKNMPVLPPTGFVAESIILLNSDIGKTYRFFPVGWEFQATPTPSPDVDPNLLAANNAADERVAGLEAQVSQLSEQVAQLLEALTKKKER